MKHQQRSPLDPPRWWEDDNSYGIYLVGLLAGGAILLTLAWLAYYAWTLYG
jgi:hypothetical protein